MASKITRALLEAYDITKAAPGQVPFKSSSMSDPHIRAIVDAASAKTGVPAAEIDAVIQKEVDKIKEMKQYSYLLYDTAARNAVESAAFDLIAHSRRDEFEKFDPVTFLKLVEMIQLENDQFFPLRAPGELNYIFTISPILVPSNKKEFQKFNSIGTAAATNNGEFIFNVPFMQKLMDWSTVEGLKPKGKKYESNGGPIPDAYAYIEFLIMHELLHYSYGDFSHGRRLKQYTPTEHNYASDFRSNYMLVKNGFDQLPVGLFSDHINYDRQRTYDEMVDLVHNELKKLPKPLQDKFGEIADRLDDHSSSQGQSTQQPVSGSTPDPDKVHQDIADKLGRRQEIGSEEEAKNKAGQRPQSSTTPSSGTSKGGQMGDMSSREREIAAIVPRFNWKTLIKQMITASVTHTDVSYAKPARRSVSGAVIARATGSAAIKPGEKTLEEPQTKLMLVFDTSGSMYGDIPTVLAETQSLLKKLGRLDNSIGLCFFADSAKYYMANMGKDVWHEIESTNELIKNAPSGKANKGWKSILTKASTGGTDFNSALAGNLNLVATAGFNVMIFSDEGINETDNFGHFKQLWQGHKDRLFFVSNNLSNFRATCQLLGQVPKTFGHL